LSDKGEEFSSKEEAPSEPGEPVERSSDSEDSEEVKEAAEESEDDAGEPEADRSSEEEGEPAFEFGKFRDAEALWSGYQNLESLFGHTQRELQLSKQQLEQYQAEVEEARRRAAEVEQQAQSIALQRVAANPPRFDELNDEQQNYYYEKAQAAGTSPEIEYRLELQALQLQAREEAMRAEVAQQAQQAQWASSAERFLARVGEVESDPAYSGHTRQVLETINQFPELIQVMKQMDPERVEQFGGFLVDLLFTRAAAGRMPEALKAARVQGREEAHQSRRMKRQARTEAGSARTVAPGKGSGKGTETGSLLDSLIHETAPMWG
jgi:hypothetical protein